MYRAQSRGEHGNRRRAQVYKISILGLILVSACGGKSDEGEAINDEELTLANCDESLSADLPTFFADYFACVDASMQGDSVVMTTDGLPPHPSAYYPSGDPNYVPFDDRGGTHFKNPNELDIQNYTMTVSMTPTPKGITIDSGLVDNSMGTSDEEYPGGPQGLALNGVIVFAAMAAPGDDLADEQYTFDSYEAHPAFTTYHYHFNTPGPLDVLVDRGFSSSTVFNSGDIELYAMMCDGTVVLGCTELDGSTPSAADFDAQNGHVHDITNGTDTLLAERYHTHVCASEWADYPFFPEIAYYEDGNCTPGGP
jgi:hypothetical protein